MTQIFQELDLSENLLGKDENLNAVKPDTITAGESLAVLLQDCRCPIHTLKVSSPFPLSSMSHINSLHGI